MTQRVNIDLDKALWHRVGVRAAEKGITKRELTETALKNYLEEEEKMTKELTFEEMVEQARDQITGNDFVRLMDKARYAATDNGIFTDDKDEWDKNGQYLVADMQDIVQAYCDDYSIKEVFDINPAEADDGAEAFCKRHGIEILG